MMIVNSLNYTECRGKALWAGVRLAESTGSAIVGKPAVWPRIRSADSDDHPLIQARSAP